MELKDWEATIASVAQGDELPSVKIDMLYDLRTRIEGAQEFIGDLKPTPEIEKTLLLLKDLILTVDDTMDSLGDDVTKNKPRPKWSTEDVKVFHEQPGTLERLRAEREG